MANKYNTVNELMTGIADAIRTKKETTGTIASQDMPDEILSIEGGTKKELIEIFSVVLQSDNSLIGRPFTFEVYSSDLLNVVYSETITDFNGYKTIIVSNKIHTNELYYYGISLDDDPDFKYEVLPNIMSIFKTDKADNSISISYRVIKAEIELQNKTITANGTYTADAGYDGLGQIDVNVPSVVPTGSINITENGSYDVADYATANVNVSGGGGGLVGLDDLYNFAYPVKSGVVYAPTFLYRIYNTQGHDINYFKTFVSKYPKTADNAFSFYVGSTGDAKKNATAIIELINYLDFSQCTSMKNFLYDVNTGANESYIGSGNLPLNLSINANACENMNYSFYCRSSDAPSYTNKVNFNGSTGNVKDFEYMFSTYSKTTCNIYKEILNINMDKCEKCTNMFNNNGFAHITRFTFDGSFGGNSDAGILTLKLSFYDTRAQEAEANYMDMTYAGFLEMAKSISPNKSGKRRIFSICDATYGEWFSGDWDTGEDTEDEPLENAEEILTEKGYEIMTWTMV